MENVATVEQAEPQGSAAPDVAASAPPRDARPQKPSPADTSSRDLLRRGLEARSASRNGASSATQETSAADEQPASSTSPARDAEASKTGTDQPTDPQQPRLSRAERKALKTAQPEPAPATPATASADTSASPTAPAPEDRIERVERTLTDALSRIESRLPAPAEPSAQPAAPAQSQEDIDYYGDDAEYIRLANIALRPGTTGEFLDNENSAKLETWTLRRETRDRTNQSAAQVYSLNQSNIALAAAEAHGIDSQSLYSAPSMRAIYDTFVERGRAIEREAAAAREAESAKEIDRLKGVNQQLADELEGYENRAPGLARSLVGGGMSAYTRGSQIADRAHMSGSQHIRAALAAGPSKSRPGNRSQGRGRA